MMKNSLFILIVNFFIVGIFAQDNPSFYIEIPNELYVPEVSHDENGKPIGTTNTGNARLDELINSYEIYGNQQVFENSNNQLLQNIYLIECNDIDLMYELFNNYENYYPRVEDAFVEILLIPNDIGTVGGYAQTDQEELYYIRAPEAWDITTGSNNIVIGIPDPENFQTDHEDLENTLEVLFGNNIPTSTQHGTIVSSIAAAETNNAIGMAAIGFDSYIYGAKGTSNILNLSNEPNVRILSASYGSSSLNPPTITPAVFEEIIEINGDIVIAAAGNGPNPVTGHPPATFYYRPASYKGVISVSGIGHQNESFSSTHGLVEVFQDSFEYKLGGNIRTLQYNDSIDIVAPAIGLLVANGLGYINNARGTSIAAPMVAGTVALMLDMNYCLENKEVETILKLTAVVIDTLPQNIQYYGKLGAGKLDAYEAVKMAKDMSEEFGTVEVKNRILYRPWFYKLETAPYEIKMFNNTVTDGAKLKFRARSNIEITSGLYSPIEGYIDLQIDPSLDMDCPPPTSGFRYEDGNLDTEEKADINYLIYPTVVDELIIIKELFKDEVMSSIEIYDLSGVLALKEGSISNSTISLNLVNLKPGIYIIKIFDRNRNVLNARKIIKK